MQNQQLVRDLKRESTWQLVFLSFITLGVYGALYIKEQTSKINTLLDPPQQISKNYTDAIFILACVGVPLSLYAIATEGDELVELDNFTSMVFVVMVTIWAFHFRSRLHELLGITPNDPNAFNGFWTLVFAVPYTNYKINCLNDHLDQLQAVPAPTTPPEAAETKRID